MPTHSSNERGSAERPHKPGNRMTSVIIDTDPGTDDAIALTMALNGPDLDVVGVTTVGGNATLAHTTRNALRVLEHVGRADVPVHRGAARPLRGKYHYGYYFHGAAGLGVRLPAPRTAPRTNPWRACASSISPGRSPARSAPAFWPISEPT